MLMNNFIDIHVPIILLLIYYYYLNRDLSLTKKNLPIMLSSSGKMPHFKHVWDMRGRIQGLSPDKDKLLS